DDLLDDDPLVPAEHGLDRLADFADLYSKVVQNLGGQAFTLTEQSKEQVLCADVTVVRSFCFFLRERQNFLGPLSESFKRIQGPYPPGLLSTTWVGPAPPLTLLWYPTVPPHLI